MSAVVSLPSPRFRPIPGLLGGCLPADITWLVVAVVVDPPQRMLWRRRGTNVFKKRFEARLPSLADRDSPPTIPVVALVAWAGTSLPHGKPRPIFFAAGFLMRSSAAGLMMHRCFECLLWGPSPPESGKQGVVIDRDQHRPRSDTRNETVISDCSCHRYYLCVVEAKIAWVGVRLSRARDWGGLIE